VRRLLAPHSLVALRAVCRHWRWVVDEHLTCLRPPALRAPRHLAARFPSLTALHLTCCANVRNRDLQVLRPAAAGGVPGWVCTCASSVLRRRDGFGCCCC
jgi:hypothetical protein